MKILKIVNSHDWGGVFTCEGQYIKQFKSNGIEVELVIIGTGRNLENYRAMVDHSINLPDLMSGFEGSVFNKIKGIFKAYKYGYSNISKVLQHVVSCDVVIYRRANFLFFAGLLAEKLGSSCFWHLSENINGDLSRKFYEIFCFKYSIIAIGNSYFTQLSSGKLVKDFVYPGFSNERVVQSDRNLRQKLNIGASVPVYGMVARIATDKAQDLLIEGFLQSEAISAGAHLLLAGSSKDIEFLKKLEVISGKQRGERIHFLGEINNLPEFYATIDVAVNARRNAEPFGISVAEALGAGKPVIAYYLGGPSEMIEDKLNGWLVKESTAQSYCEAINLSFSNRSNWAIMGERAKAGAGRFTVEENVTKLIQILQQHITKSGN